jgi:hypothetical protein
MGADLVASDDTQFAFWLFTMSQQHRESHITNLNSG